LVQLRALLCQKRRLVRPKRARHKRIVRWDDGSGRGQGRPGARRGTTRCGSVTRWRAPFAR